MKKRLKYRKISCVAISMIIVFNSQAQRQFTVTSSKQNNYCNTTCTLLDNPDLNGNPAAVIFITQVGNLNPHPVCAYYIGKQWSIKNIDGVSIQPGAQFNVEYYLTPDDTHFVHVVTRENLVKKISYIDHPGLNDNPGAQFRFFQNWAPGLRGGNANRNEISIQYDAVARKWYISNSNNSQLEFPVAYNIIISNGGNTVAGPDKAIPGIPVNNPTTIIKPADNMPVVNKPAVQKEIVPGKILPKTYDLKDLDICFDIINNNSLPPKPVYTPPRAIPKINFNGDLLPVTKVEQPLSVFTDKMWNPGDVLTVGFYYDGSTPYIIDKIMYYARWWEKYANIKFDFISDVKQAIIKIGFEQEGFWSSIGRDALTCYLGYQTMNFHGFHDNSDESFFRRKILHEFGHALGFIHEHQASTSGIPWDKEKVYSYFGKSPISWSREMVDQQIFEKYSKTSTNSSSYDKSSIMHYSIPAELTTDGSSYPANTFFSAIDTQFAKLVYPFPPAPTNSSGVLHTGDDCDEIEFFVEYNAVSKDVIEFSLEPGMDANNNKITWWKKMAIPVVGNGEVGLEMQDGHFASRTVAVAIIDKGRGISFGKAKGLGVHTGLNYTWNAWPAIIGGCRVRFVWRRDKC